MPVERDFDVLGEPVVHHIDLDFLESYRFADGEGFPPSYRNFVTRYGWARTLGLWLVYPPVHEGYADGWQGRARTLTDRFRAIYADNRAEDFDFTLEPDGEWMLIERLEVFASSENGDALLWDTRARDDSGEFDIWLSANLNSLKRLDSPLHRALLELPGFPDASGQTARTVEPLEAHRL